LPAAANRFDLDAHGAGCVQERRSGGRLGLASGRLKDNPIDWLVGWFWHEWINSRISDFTPGELYVKSSEMTNTALAGLQLAPYPRPGL
jgi:hypothetical protein